MPLWHGVFVQREGLMTTMSIIIVLAIPLGCLFGCILGALAEITLKGEHHV